MKTHHVIPDHAQGERLDKVVRELFDLPWSKARAWIVSGKISLDNTRETELDLKTAPGQTVRYTEDAPRLTKASELDPALILFKDPHIIVLNKPSGILTVPWEGDLVSFDKQVRSHLAHTAPKNQKRRGARPSLMAVHRLDRGTSGILVFARTWIAKEGLSAQFREHSTHRVYRALAHGKVNSGVIVSHLLPDRGDGIRGSREHSPNHKLRKSGKGQRAVTHVTCLRTEQGVSEITCKLETGRTNQVRIHLAESGHPLLGEKIYLRGFRGTKINAPRLMLHAEELGFTHPVSEEPMSFKQAPPADFRRP